MFPKWRVRTVFLILGLVCRRWRGGRAGLVGILLVESSVCLKMPKCRALDLQGGGLAGVAGRV